MSSVQQNPESIVNDDRGLATAAISQNPSNISAALDLEGIATQDPELERVIEAERLKLSSTEPARDLEPEAKKIINHPIAKAAGKSLNGQIDTFVEPSDTKASPSAAVSSAPNTIKEGKLRVGKRLPISPEISRETERDAAITKAVTTPQGPATITQTMPSTISVDVPEVPAHLLEKLNLKNPPTLAPLSQSSELTTAQASTAVEIKSSISLEAQAEPQLMQAERTTLSLEQAMKLDLSLAKIGMGQSTKPLTFRGHRLSSGTMLDRLITAIADFVKRLEMRFVSFLTRKRLDRKVQKAKPVKVVLPTEDEDSLHTASFSNSLSKSRKKRNLWLSKFTLERK